MMEDIRVVIGESKFDVRACGILKQGDNVLTTVESDGTHTLPGGAVKIGETSKEAVVREFLEETGIKVGVGSLLSIIENMFIYEEKPYQQVIFVYEVFALKDIQSNIGEVPVEWTNIMASHSLRPPQLNELVKQATTTTQHFINKEL